MLVKAGTTDYSATIRIIDSTDGTPETGVIHTTSGIDLWYRRDVDPGSTPLAAVDITEAGLAALTTAHSDGGIAHIGDGYYRLDLPDAAVAAGAIGCLVGGTVTGMIVIGCYIELVGYDPQDTVRLGLTSLPNAAVSAAGGLAVSAGGAVGIDDLPTAAADAVWDEAQADHVGAGTFGIIASEIADVPTVSEFEARTLVAASYFNSNTDTVNANVVTISNGQVYGTGTSIDLWRGEP